MDRRTLALIYLAHASDVLENAFAPLSDDDYEVRYGSVLNFVHAALSVYVILSFNENCIGYTDQLYGINGIKFLFLVHSNALIHTCTLPQVAMKRVRDLLDLDLDAEAAKPNANDLMWSVFAAFIK